jgi:hypothetical protein
MNASSGHSLAKPWVALLGTTFVLAIAFVLIAATPYLLGNAEKLGRYDGKKAWIIAHIAFGMVALLIGPVQLWLGFTRPRDPWHRRLGMLYLGAIFASSVPAYYLAVATDVSFTFGFGLGSLATAWLLTAGLAMLAVKRRSFLQHQEWMVRSYVVTFGFVLFRIFLIGMTVLNVGSRVDRLNVASWLCWAAPLVLCEAVIQGRKLRSASTPVDA